MARPRLAPDARVIRQLRMRTGADAEVVAEGPVVEVVPARFSRFGKGRSFVVVEAGADEFRFDQFQHVGGRILVGQRRRRMMEGSVRFQRQVIGADVRDTGGKGGHDVAPCFVHRLLRQGDHQVEIDAREVQLRQLDGTACFVAGMDAAECRELAIIKALDAEREPVDASVPVGLETIGLYRARIGFERDFGAGQQR